MKKFLIFFMIVVLIFSLAGIGFAKSDMLGSDKDFFFSPKGKLELETGVFFKHEDNKEREEHFFTGGKWQEKWKRLKFSLDLRNFFSLNEYSDDYLEGVFKISYSPKALGLLDLGLKVKQEHYWQADIQEYKLEPYVSLGITKKTDLFFRGSWEWEREEGKTEFERELMLGIRISFD